MVRLRQITALLWKDYLVRLRQPWMMVMQIFWPVSLFASLYILRFHYFAVDVDTCQFPTRQLPNKMSILPYFQSYLCNIDNACIDPNNYEEISAFHNAPLTPVLNIVQTILNEPKLFNMIMDLPTTMKIFDLFMAIVKHHMFVYLRENVNTIREHFAEYQELIGGEFDVKKAWSGDGAIFSTFTKILCGKPFANSSASPDMEFFEGVLYQEDNNGPDKDELDAMPTKFCKQLYLDVTKTIKGKIIWTLLKPIIQGKIVYGPSSSNIAEIMSHVNGTFEGVNRLKMLIGGISRVVTGLRTNDMFRSELDKVVQMSKSLLFKEVLSTMSIDLTNVDTMHNTIINDTTIPFVLNGMDNILDCISVDRFVPVETADELESVARALNKQKLFYGGIFFNDAANISNAKDITYTIRMEIDNTPKTIVNRNPFWYPGPRGNFAEEMRYHRGFIDFQYAVDTSIIKWLKKRQNDERKLFKATPSEPMEMDTDRVVLPYKSNLVAEKIAENPPLSIGFDVSHVKVNANSLNNVFEDNWKISGDKPQLVDGFQDNWSALGLKRTKRASSIDGQLDSSHPTESETYEVDQLNVYTKQFPYPKYRKDDFKKGLYMSQLIQVVFFFGLIVQVASAVRYRIWMKESGNRRLMQTMGLLKSSDLIAWIITTMLELIVIFVLGIVVLYSGGILETTNIPFMFMFLFSFGLNLLAFCYMTSAFYSSASLGSVSAMILYVLSYLPFMLILSLGASLTMVGKILTNLSFSTPFCFAWQHIMRMELQQLPLTFGNAFDGTFHDNDLKLGMIMTVVDICIYALAGYLCERYMENDCKFYKVAVKDMDESIGAAMVDATKCYDTVRPAVDSVSVEFRRNHITCLLGRNGAGKSTIIKLLTGQIRASSGDVYLPQSVNRLTGDQATQTVGLCPQDDVLIPNITAKEHLQLYAKIKLQHGPSEDEVQQIMQSLDFGKYEDYMAEHLSGGFKRRLNIGIAFIGSPDLVILDEPCSAIDTNARKNIWKIIMALRTGRAVILATHYLDEAEHLSDQVYILKEGILVSELSQKSLSEQFTKSFDLYIELPSNTTDTVTYALKQQLRDLAMHCTIVDVPGPGLRLTVPYYDAIEATTDFSPLIRFVEFEQHQKRVHSFKVISNSLEGIFNRLIMPNKLLNVDQVCNGVAIPMNGLNNSSVDTKRSRIDQIELPIDDKEESNKFNQTGVIRNLFWKRFMHFKRNYRLLLCVFILPVIFEATAMGFMYLRPVNEYAINLKLSTALYPDTTIFKTFENANEFVEKLNESLHCDPISCKYLQTSEDAYQWLLRTNTKYRAKRYGGISVNETVAAVWYNNKGYHAMPAFLNEFTSAALRTELNDDEFNISTYNHPIMLDHQALSLKSILQQVSDAGVSLLILLSFSLVVASFSVYIVNERTSGEKLQQKLCGVSYCSYWGVAYLWDLMIYCIALVMAMVVFWIFDIPVYTDKDNLAGVGLVLFVFGLASIPMVHVGEKLFKDSSLANMNIMCLNVISALGPRLAVLLLDIAGRSETSKSIRKVLDRVFMVIPQYAVADSILEMSNNHIMSQISARFAIDSYRSPITSTVVLPHCICMLLLGIVFAVLNFVFETGIWHEWFQKKKSYPELTPTFTPLTTKTYEKCMDALPHVLRISNLCKTYAGNRQALKDVSFHVNSGECFGLLGANGAGKSTIFSILCGEMHQTAGAVQFFDDKGISYCPQTNALDPLLTVEEVIYFYGTLKKISDLHELTNNTLCQFHLDTYRQVLVKNLSGGNRRKLSVAVSCFGNTSLVLMDEPTSDMDPITRSLVYKSIHALLRAKRSVVLTSHTITEIDRVCDRIGVMRDGEMISLGTVAQLKSRNGNNYVGTVFYEANEADAIEKEIKATIPMIVKVIVHNHCLQFIVRIKTQNPAIVEDDDRIALSDLFAKLHQLACSRRIVYTISECLLDQAFELVLASKKPDEAYTNYGFVSNDSLP